MAVADAEAPTRRFWVSTVSKSVYVALLVVMALLILVTTIWALASK